MGRRFYGFNNRFRTTKNTEAVVFENGGFVGNLGLVKKLWKKYTEAIYKYRTNTGKMTASDYTHLFGYLNPIIVLFIIYLNVENNGKYL